ncbi:hypothetical protein CNMCM5623_003958 [Aspergillus felis]|uniref:Uncharacterized protein n=1 Tax=Aspergillus felis TaxID=1287682 RepID=A0A8H6QFL6_9EURO|nr:hypothetical protein CNMCM5623_003958 [Aspergillus felis]
MTHSSVRSPVILDIYPNIGIFKQPSDNNYLPFMSRPPQSGAPFIVNAIAVCPTVLQDGVDHPQVPVTGGQGHSIELANGVDVHIRFGQQPCGHTFVIALSGPPERCHMVSVTGIDVNARLGQKQLNYSQVPSLSGFMQGRGSPLVLGVQINIRVIQKQLHNYTIPTHGRQMQWCSAVCVHFVHVPAVIEQQLHDILTPLTGGQA